MTYDRAWSLLEDADCGWKTVRDIAIPGTKAFRGIENNKERLKLWKDADRQARAKADEVVANSAKVATVRKLVARLEKTDNIRAYAKAVAARIETEALVWHKAYGLAMPKEYVL